MVSEVKVCQSNAGYYIGTMFKGLYCWEPNERLSGYYPTKKMCQKALTAFNKLQVINIGGLNEAR